MKEKSVTKKFLVTFLRELILKNSRDINKKKREEGFKCKQCGRCCLATEHADICIEDIKRWKKAGRENLFTDDMIIEWDYFGASGLFRNFRTSRCPFLRKRKDKYYCKIQDIKPEFCRQFPKDRKHAKEFCGCPGYDPLFNNL